MPVEGKVQFDYIIQTKDSVPQGSYLLFEFPFTNVSDSAIVISRVRSSCGCLVPEWSREPVEPGQTGIIRGKYDTQRLGPINKTLTVEFWNIEEQVVLRILGAVWEGPNSQHKK